MKQKDNTINNNYLTTWDHFHWYPICTCQNSRREI